MARASTSSGVAQLGCASLAFLCAGCGQSPSGSDHRRIELPPFFSEESTTLRCTFHVINPLPRTVTIESLNHSCACASAVIEDRVLEPNEATQLHVEANIRDRRGRQLFACNLVTKNQETWRYEASTTIYPKPSFDRQSLNLGLVGRNEQVERKVVFEAYARNAEDLPRIVSVENSNTQLVRTALGEARESLNRDGIAKLIVPLTVVLLPQKEASNGSSCIVGLSYRRGNQSHESIGLPVSWKVRSPYVVTPARVFFANVATATGPIERRVTIRRADGRAFSITKLEYDCEPLNCSVAVQAPSPEQEVVFSLQHKQLKGPLFGQVHIHTDHSSDRLIRVSYAGFWKSLVQ